MFRKIFSGLNLLLFIIILNLSITQAQNVRVTAKPDTNHVLIGDQIHLLLNLTSDEPVKVNWPKIPDSVGSIEILNKSPLDTVKQQGKFSLTQKLTVTSFDSGSFVIPAFTFTYERKGMNEPYPVMSDSIVLKFRTVSVDTSKAFKDIKPPIEEPYTFDEYLIYILIALGVMAIAIAGWFLWKRLKNKPKVTPEYDPRIPPHVIALEALKQLESEKLWQKNQIKLYYIRLTEIVRLYIERRYHIQALEMITQDIITAMDETDITPPSISVLNNLLTLADLVKFAKHVPVPEEHTLAMSNAVSFVNSTKLGENLKDDTEGGSNV